MKNKSNIETGWLYAYVHFITEVVCFYILGNKLGNSVFLWLVPFIYDELAFAPQSIIGYISDKFPKINVGIIGTFLLAAGVLFCSVDVLPGKYTALVILCIGNACMHIGGAEVTLRSSAGKLSHSAIFVGGGSFGVISGKLLSKTPVPFYAVIILAFTMIPFVLLAETYRKMADSESACPCAGFDYHSEKIPPAVVIILAVFIVMVRGYMGYGIPTSWNKTVVQNIIFYVTMGIGKMAGGIVADKIGVKKTAMISVLGALPFLLFGDKIMMVSLIGIMIFSMTMSITLALLVSVLKNAPGLAFGLTTIGLFLGTTPIFFFKFTTVTANCLLIAALSAVCVAVLQIIIRKDENKHGQLQNSCK